MFQHHKPKIEKRCFFMECDERKTEDKTIDDIKEEMLCLLIDTEKKNETEIDVKISYLGNAVRNAKDVK